MLGRVGTGQDWSCWTGQVNVGQDWSGQVRIGLDRLGQFMTGQVGSIQVRKSKNNQNICVPYHDKHS